MLKRLFPCLAMFCLVTASLVTRAAEVKAAAPDVVVRLQSIDGLLSHGKYLSTLAGQEEGYKQFEEMIKAKAGPKGLEGIDTRRPLGLYATIKPNVTDSTAVFLIPISNEDAALGLLKNLGVKAEKGKDDVYTLTTDQAPVQGFLRFANKYAYITAQSQEAINKANLLDPSHVLALDPKAVASITVRIDQIPDNLKQMGIQNIELMVANLKDQRDKKETDAQHKLKVAMLDMMSGTLVSVLKDGGETSIRLDMDQKTNDLTLEISLAGKANSKLAANIAGLGQTPSLVGGMVGKDSALSLVAHGTIPEEFRKAFEQFMEAELPKELEKEKDPAKREFASKVLKSFGQSFKSGEIDVIVDMRGPSPNKLYSMLLAGKVSNGLELEKLFRDSIQTMKPDEQAKIKLDAEQVGPIKIHRLENLKEDKEFTKNFGKNPMYLAFRHDAIIAGLGDNGLAIVKEALAARPGPTGLFRMEASIMRLAPLGEDFSGIPKAVEAALAKDKDGDKVVLTLQGGKELKLTLNVKMTLVKLIGEMDKVKPQKKTKERKIEIEIPKK